MATGDKKRWRVWITLSEMVGVLALVIAGLNFWDSHRDRVSSEKREAAEQQAAASQVAARESFVLTARADGDGARLVFQPMSSDQAVQGERFLAPSDLGLTADQTVQPVLSRDWLADGLRRAVAQARHARQAGRDGEGEMPLGVVATYVENGELRTDQSLYRLAYSWKTPLIGGPRITLEGAALARRGLKGDLQAVVDAAWARSHPQG